MAASLHGSACTTPRVRAELQAAREATRALAAWYGLNPKTACRWSHRTGTADAPMGPRRARSSVLTEAEEAFVVEFRRRTLLPLDDVPGCSRGTSLTLSRNALHRSFLRHGPSRLPRHALAKLTPGIAHRPFDAPKPQAAMDLRSRSWAG